jgi:acetyl-CoA carboxylase carboxyl transferase subunit beta
MAWFKRDKTGLIPQTKKELPDGLWLKCDSCNEMVYKKELERNLYVCMKCGYHFRMKSNLYIKILLDDGEFNEFNSQIKSVDALKFRAQKRYSDQLKDTYKKTGSNEAVLTGFGRIDSYPVVFCVMDFSFVGGSMGSVVGEKVARATKEAINKKLPLIIISASGGARMQEGAMSLMQMAKTSAYLAKLSDSGLPFISIVTNPTTGGVSASYAMLGDVIIAEPGALIGFAGPRVIKQTIGQDLPEGFQTSEFLLKHGFIDAIFTRKEMKEKLATMLKFFGCEKEESNEPTETDNHSIDQ